MRTHKQQSGFLSWQVVIILVFFSFLFLCATKLGPHYFEHKYIDTALKSLAKDNADISELTDQEIIRDLKNFMVINNVRTKEAKNFKIIRSQDKLVINNVYEIRVPFFLNIDVVLSFKSQLNSKTPEFCCMYREDGENEKK